MIKEDQEGKDLDFLPEAMVEEMLSKQKDVIGRIGGRIRNLSSIKEEARGILSDIGLLKNFTNIVRQKSYPTTVGTDGSNSRIMQLSMDTSAVAAVAVEGLIPPRENRIWEKPHHIVNLFLLEHSPYTVELLRYLMFSYELELASKAPHRVVMLDGSFTSVLVSIGQGLYTRNLGPTELKNEIESKILQTLNNFQMLLTSPRMDQIFVAIPKYTERREIITKLEDKGMNYPFLIGQDDKAFLTMVLHPQEFVGPVKLEEPKSPWHLTGVPEQNTDLKNKITQAMDELYVVYVKPSAIHPALRAEIPASVAMNEHRLLILLEALIEQTTIPGIFEPYPLYIADMFVKHVHGSLIELREAAISDMAKFKELNLPDFYLSLHDYRSEERFE